MVHQRESNMLGLRQSVRSCAIAFTLTMACVAPSTAQQPTTQQPAAQQPSAAAVEGWRYVLANTRRGGVPYILNLADQKQYEYVLDFLARTGATPQNRPEIFRSLERAHQRGAAGPPVLHPAYDSQVPKTEVAARLQRLADVPPNPQNSQLVSILNDASVPPNRQYDARSLASVYGGAFQVITLLSLAAQPSGQQPVVFANNRTEQANPNVPIFPASLNGTLPNQYQIGTTVVANALTLVYLTPTSSTPIPVSSTWEDSVDTTAGCLQAPTYKAQQGSGQCVNSGPITPPLQVCWYRGSPDSCDYYNTNGQPTTFVFPLQGNATFPSQVASPPFGDVVLTLIVASGGGCVLRSQTGAGLNGFTVGGTGNTVLSWNFAAASFPNTNSCLASGGVITNLNLNVAVLLSSGQYGSFSITSDTSQRGNPATYIIPQLNIVWGCVAEGTLVSLADGAQVPIEKLVDKHGTAVMSSDGTQRKIEDVTKGTEPEPMYVIADDRGDTLKLTQSHPVFTSRGIKPAHALEVGDVVTTTHGVAHITKIRREMAKGLVYNLRLGSEDEARAGHTAMYANGIMVGDVSLQRLMDREAATVAVRPALTDDEIRREIPKRWQQDFLNERHGG
jgi:hypothetical protein